MSNKIFHQIEKYYPSSQICHKCDFQNKELKLSDREWICSNCESILNRDGNASINIEKKGFEELKKSRDIELLAREYKTSQEAVLV